MERSSSGKLEFANTQGKIVALLGPNGSGKSTFLKLFAGLIHPSSGKALVLGEEAGTATKSKVAYVPEFNHLYRWQTAGEAVEFASSFFPDLDLEIAGKLLEQMQLERNRKSHPFPKACRQGSN